MPELIPLFIFLLPMVCPMMPCLTNHRPFHLCTWTLILEHAMEILCLPGKVGLGLYSLPIL